MIEQSKMPSALDYLSTINPKLGGNVGGGENILTSTNLIKNVNDGISKEDALSLYPELGEDYIDDLMVDIKNGADVETLIKFYPEISGEVKGETLVPDLVTKDEIKNNPSIFKQISSLGSSFFREGGKEERQELREKIKDKDSGLYNFAGGSATGLIETAGLIESGKEFEDRVETAPLNLLFKALPNDLQSQVEKYLPDNITRENILEGTLDPLNRATKAKEDIQSSIGVDSDAISTKVGEFLTPDTFAGIGALLKGGTKLAPKLVDGVRKNTGDIAEYFVRLSGGLRKGSLEKDIKFLTDNPEQALKEMNLGGEDLIKILDDIKTQLPEGAIKEVDEIEKIKTKIISEITERGAKQSDEIIEAGNKASLQLEEMADIARENIANKSADLKLTGEGYRDFVGTPSTQTGQQLIDDYLVGITNNNKTLSTPAKQALETFKSEVDNVASLNPEGILKYEDLQQIRKNIDDNINWGDTTASVKNKWLKKFRDDFDKNIIKTEFPDVKILDEKYASQIKELDEIKKTLGKNGEESEGFRKSLLNLYKPGNEEKLRKRAELLGVSPEQLREVSKSVSENVALSSKKVDVSGDINKINLIETVPKLKDTINKLGSNQNIDELEKLSKNNEYFKDIINAIKADSDKAVISKTTDNSENLIATIYKMLDVEKGTNAGNKADVALALLEKKIGKDNMLKIKVAKSINKIKETPNEGTIASLIFNLAPVKAPILGPILKKFVGTPEKALDFVVKRAKRLKDAELENIAKKVEEGKNLSSKEVEEFATNLMNFDFGAKTTSNILDDE